MPEGQGFLPAFWMMPTDENLYGQWPRCGEIDIMEVLGNDTTKSYGTVHYGNPHSEQQGSYVLPSGSFSSEYHNFAVEWEPGRINWYVDGNLIHTANDWYSATEGQGEITYPAPFDQPFYIILNLAVGGNWPGSPDETTNIAQAAMYIDYVRVYQKDSYDEDVSVPRRWWSCAIRRQRELHRQRRLRPGRGPGGRVRLDLPDHPGRAGPGSHPEQHHADRHDRRGHRGLQRPAGAARPAPETGRRLSGQL